MSKLKQISHKVSLSFAQAEALNNLMQSIVHMQVNTQEQFKYDIFMLMKQAAADLMIRLVNRPWRDQGDKPVNQIVFTVCEIRTIIACMHYVKIPAEFKRDQDTLDALITYLRSILGETAFKKSDIILLNKPLVN
jgi:hypothetical protein